MSFIPNKEQQKVIEHRGKPLVVMAGPGTGKTRTLVERMIQILRSNLQARVSFITFTRSSRRDTKNRLEETLGISQDVDEYEDFPLVSTLHTFAKSLVHKCKEKVGLKEGFSVLVQKKEDILVIQEVIEDLSLQIDSRLLKDLIQEFKCTGIMPQLTDISEIDFDSAYERYLALCKFYNTIDIEGLVADACEILNSGIEIPNIFLHVDEYQDLNSTDLKFISSLISNEIHEVVVVGDDDQSIYQRLRFAHPQGIRDLMAKNNWEHVIFKKCHRIPPYILRASQALISNHKGPRYIKKILLPDDDGKKIPTFQCTKTAVEIELIAKKIRELKAQQKKISGETLEYKDFMVLCPNKKTVAEWSTALTIRFDIPAKGKESKQIPDNVWRLLLILRMIDSDDNLALRQWLEIIGVDPEVIGEMRLAAETKGISLFDFSRQCVNKKTRELVRLIDKLREIRALSTFNEKLRTVSELDVSDELLTEIGLDINKSEKNVKSIENMVIKIYKAYGLLDPEEKLDTGDAVLVTTLHSAKGLEAEVVFIVRVEDRFMPSPGRDQDEELRVLYVGVTRAAQMLFFSFCERYDSKRKKYLRTNAMSPFLASIKSYIEVIRVTKEDLNNLVTGTSGTVPGTHQCG